MELTRQEKALINIFKKLEVDSETIVVLIMILYQAKEKKEERIMKIVDYIDEENKKNTLDGEQAIQRALRIAVTGK